MGAIDLSGFAYGAIRGQDDQAAQTDLRRRNQQEYDIRQQALDEAKTSAPMRQQQTQQALDTGGLQNRAAALNLKGAEDNQANLQFQNGIKNQLQNFVGSGGADANSVARMFDLTAQHAGKQVTHTAAAGKDDAGKSYIEVTDSNGSKVRFADNTPNPVIGAGAEHMTAHEQVMLFGEYMANPGQFSTRQQAMRDKQTERTNKLSDETTKFFQQITLEQLKSGNRTAEHMSQVKGNIERALRSDPIFSTLKPEEQRQQREQIYKQVFGEQAPAAAAPAPGQQATGGQAPAKATFGAAVAQAPIAGATAFDYQGQKVWATKGPDGMRPITRKDGSLVPVGGGVTPAPAAATPGAAPFAGTGGEIAVNAAPAAAPAAPAAAPKQQAIPTFNSASGAAQMGLSMKAQTLQKREAIARDVGAKKERRQKESYAQAFRDIVKTGRYNADDRHVIEGAMNSGILNGDEERTASTMLDQMPK